MRHIVLVAECDHHLLHSYVLPISIRRRNGALLLSSSLSLSILISILKRFSNTGVSTSYVYFFTKRNISFSYGLITLLLCWRMWTIRGNLTWWYRFKWHGMKINLWDWTQCRIKQDSCEGIEMGKVQKKEAIMAHSTNFWRPRMFLTLYWKELFLVGKQMCTIILQISVKC